MHYNFLQKYERGWRWGVGSLSLDVQGRGGGGLSPNSDPFAHKQKKGGRGAKIGHFSWMSSMYGPPPELKLVYDFLKNR